MRASPLRSHSELTLRKWRLTTTCQLFDLFRKTLSRLSCRAVHLLTSAAEARPASIFGCPCRSLLVAFECSSFSFPCANFHLKFEFEAAPRKRLATSVPTTVASVV